MQESWTRILSFALFSVLALQVEALPKKKATAASGGGTGTNAAAAASPSVSAATDGSQILDKTVNIK